jgi:hypothetical protein
MRKAITFDGKYWYVRRIAYVRQDDIHNEMVYHCDKHLGGPYKKLEDIPIIKKRIKNDRN